MALKLREITYENRYVAYIDIIGWEDRTKKEPIDEAVLDVIECLSAEADSLKDDHQDPNGNGTLQFCFCSDSFFTSSRHENQIVSIGNIVRKLLSIGLLCRGAITKGHCYHKNNIIFGDAVNKAVRLEQKKCPNSSRMPAILIDASAIDLEKYKVHHPPTKRDFTFIIKDEYNRSVLNIVPPQSGLKNLSAAERSKIQEDILYYTKIKECFEINKKRSNSEHAEKWAYAEALFDKQWQENFKSAI